MSEWVDSEELCAGYWWFCGRLSEEHEPMLDVVMLGEDESGNLLVTLDGATSPFSEFDWLGAWLCIEEPEPPAPPLGDAKTWEYMGYEEIESEPFDCYCDGGYTCFGCAVRS